MIQKNIFKRLLIGAKKGILTPNLPSHILKIHNSVLIRIFRFLGGLSFIILLGNNYFHNSIYLISVLMLFAFLFTIYHVIISYLRVKHIFKILKSDQLDIKKSPLDRR